MWGQTYDIAIVGGGITGCAIARDAAGRGLSVFLCEEGDLGRGASSAGLKLLGTAPRHALRLLHGDERAALRERDRLLAAAPHVVRPLRLVAPERGGALARGLTRARLAAYDRALPGGLLPPSLPVTLGADRRGAVLHHDIGTGFEYSDCIVDDARLVILAAADARNRGAEIRPRTRCVVAEREGTVWRLAMDAERGERYALAARTLVIAAGAWTPAVLDHVVHGDTRPAIRLVKETTVVVPRLYDHDRGYVLRNGDGRTVFVAPYERRFTLIGAAEEDYHGDPAEAAADSAGIAYLLAAVGLYLRRPVFIEDVAWAWAGIRAVREPGERRFGDRRGQAVELHGAGGAPPLAMVPGGPLVMHRRLAEEVLERLAPHLGARAPWTAGAALPGGLFPVDGLAELAGGLRALYPFLAASHAARLVGLYGTRAHSIVSGARSMADLGRVFGGDLTEAEVRYLMREEWAETAEDVLFRRTKLCLRLSPAETASLDAWLAAGAPSGLPRRGAA